jgi:hypothetical protein
VKALLQHTARVDKLRAVANCAKQGLDLWLGRPAGALPEQPDERRAITIVGLEPSRAECALAAVVSDGRTVAMTQASVARSPLPMPDAKPPSPPGRSPAIQ